MQQSSWNGYIFEVSASRVLALSSLETTVAVKKESDSETGKSTVTGKELQELTLSLALTRAAGVDPRAEYDKLEAMIGQYSPFILNGLPFGAALYQLRAVSLSDIQLNPAGDFIAATLSLELKEYASGKGVAALQILYKGKDIYPHISVNTCTYDMYAQSQADSLTLVFNDTSKQWDAWAAENDETITVIYGGINTGEMYIHDLKPDNGVYTLKAQSVPPTFKNRVSKSWQDITLDALGAEIASRHGLSYEAYDLPQVRYNYVCQDNEQDFVFLDKRLKLEGCAFLVYNKKLVVYGEKARENASAVDTVYIGPEGQFTYSDNSAKTYKSAEVLNGSYKGTYTASSEQGDKIYHKTITTVAGSNDEITRWAQGLLRLQNKTGKTGEINRDLMHQIAAGSVINLKTQGAKSWDGSAFIYHVRDDFQKRKTKIWVRRPLDY